jgi:membrane protein required for beta-lactamase induction
MTSLELAILGLQQALETPRRHHMWRWLVRNRLAGVRDALAGDSARGGEAWLAARELSLHRDRSALLGRLAVIGPQVLETPDVEVVRSDLQRLVHDLERYRQRVNDLVYDAVSLELGGSE